MSIVLIFCVCVLNLFVRYCMWLSLLVLGMFSVVSVIWFVGVIMKVCDRFR